MGTGGVGAGRGFGVAGTGLGFARCLDPPFEIWTLTATLPPALLVTTILHPGVPVVGVGLSALTLSVALENVGPIVPGVIDTVANCEHP